MQNSDRDTHFQGFARLLWNDLLEANGHGYIDVNTDDDPADGWSSLDGKVERPGYLTVIARRAYDLVEHASKGGDTSYYDTNGFPIDRLFAPEDIPDMTAWSESEAHDDH